MTCYQVQASDICLIWTIPKLSQRMLHMKEERQGKVMRKIHANVGSFRWNRSQCPGLGKWHSKVIWLCDFVVVHFLFEKDEMM